MPVLLLTQKMKFSSVTSLAILVASVTGTPAKSSSSESELSTQVVLIPSFADAFTTTIKACHDAPAHVVVGYPNGTFQPGTRTIFLPPQASATSTSWVDKALDRELLLFPSRSELIKQMAHLP